MTENQSAEPLRLRGAITPFVAGLAAFLCWPSELFLGKRTDALQKARDLPATSRRAIRVEKYIGTWLFLEAAAYGLLQVTADASACSRAIAWVTSIAIAIRALEIPSSAARITFFDRVDAPGGENAVASRERIVVLGLLNFVELSLCFAVFYAAGASCLVASRSLDWFDPFYFSAVTQLTIGYGDIQPISGLRIVVIVQGLFSLLLLVILIGRFVSLLPEEIDLNEERGGKA
jgi:hypothetical protein